MKYICLISNLILGLNAFKHLTELYIVGDSLSDTGNTFELTGGKIPIPRLYANKRYSNGRIWNDYLVERYPKLTIKNYAYGGATTDNEVLQLQEHIPSLKDQAIKVSNDLKQPIPDKCGSHEEPNKIAVVWSGGNDFLVNATIASQSIVQNLMKTVKILQDTKKFNNIFVFNLANHVRTPFGNGLPAAQKEGLNQATIQLNQFLAKSIIEEQEKDKTSRLTLVDVDQIAAKLISTPSSKSLKWEPLNYCLDNYNFETTQICNNPQDYFFWDKLHPNTISHERISVEFDNILKQLKLV